MTTGCELRPTCPSCRVLDGGRYVAFCQLCRELQSVQILSDALDEFEDALDALEADDER